MGAQKGKDILLKLGDGSSPQTFITMAGLRAKTLSFNAKTVDVTTADSLEAWRELLPGAGVKSATISGAGLFKDSQADAQARQVFFNQTGRTWQIILPDFGVLEGVFLITALEYSGDYDGEALYALTLTSAGALSFSEIGKN